VTTTCEGFVCSRGLPSKRVRAVGKARSHVGGPRSTRASRRPVGGDDVGRERVVTTAEGATLRRHVVDSCERDTDTQPEPTRTRVSETRATLADGSADPPAAPAPTPGRSVHSDRLLRRRVLAAKPAAASMPSSACFGAKPFRLDEIEDGTRPGGKRSVTGPPRPRPF